MTKPIDWTKPLQTMDGRPARLLGKLETDTFPMVVAIKRADGREFEACYTEDGFYYLGKVTDTCDLRNVPTKKSRRVWINVYPEWQAAYQSKEEADRNAHSDRLACIETVLEWEET